MFAPSRRVETLKEYLLVTRGLSLGPYMDYGAAVGIIYVIAAIIQSRIL